ncbi:hypothetical protein ACWDKQ_33620 [Saccharopolyspora sp. NPDC000995]
MTSPSRGCVAVRRHLPRRTPSEEAHERARGHREHHRRQELVRAARHAGVTDERVLSVLLTTPREAFGALETRTAAYDDAPLLDRPRPGHEQPSLSALMLEGLALTGGEHVLEVGTAGGFPDRVAGSAGR